MAKEKDLEIIPAPAKVIFPGDETPLKAIAVEEAPLKALAVDETTLEVIPRAILLTKETKPSNTVSKVKMPKSDWSWFSTGYKEEKKEVFSFPKKEISGDYVNKSIDIRSLNEKEFAARVNGLTTIPPEKGNQYCAKGVRQSLNELFGFHSSFGEESSARNAKDYNGSKLREWRKGNLCFIEEPDNGQPKNYDVHVYGPSDDNPYGHIEIFYNGVWSSDHRQVGSSWNNPYYPNRSQSLFRLSNCPK